MARRVTVGVLVVVAIAATLVATIAIRNHDRRSASGEAAKALAPLPPGYAYAKLDGADAAATVALFKTRYGAADAAAALVSTPQDTTPGVSVVAFTRPTPPDAATLAGELRRDVTLVDPLPRTLAGQPVLFHDGDATLSSAALWVHGRLAIVAYAATSAEIEAVLTTLITANS